VTGRQYRLLLTAAARRRLAEGPPTGLQPSVAAAIGEFISGPLVESPHRVGKRLAAPFTGDLVARRGDYRVVYRIDDAAGTIVVVDIAHRSDAYRRR
jgi:mRNA-degrading endonuclease RelE of RelBE toxin-antitoxin system